MAIQNFLSGGYYGKLGATVGQRWKNKRTIRTYVVPANPRTPTQQANRGKFADAVTFAQMGMQMNYYCTLFEDPNFTKWNYRMKVARELKNAGLAGLDLIPLYPISFNPPVLLTEFSKKIITGQKHISFATPDLSLNVDRVLSLMFALYDEQDTFLGYKLYLGYYYASNPGYVEVDVDDVAEINSHCFVRIISNDDEDSATDLIGSPRLAVGDISIDIRDFNTEIKEVQKTNAGIIVIFNELWKGSATVNSVSASALCVIQGEEKTVSTAAGASLYNENGYCAVLIPSANDGGFTKPAFPNGSNFTFTIQYNGSSWQYSANGVQKNYSDADLERNFTGSFTLESDFDGRITWVTPFGNVQTRNEFDSSMRCSGRLGKTDEEDVEVVESSGTDNKIKIEVYGEFAYYPMRNGDYLKLPNLTIYANGVDYVISERNLTGVNSISESPYLEKLTWTFSREDAALFTGGLNYLQMLGRLENHHGTDSSDTMNNFLSVYPQGVGIQVVPTSSEYFYENDGDDFTVTLFCDFSNSAGTENIDENATVEASEPVTVNGGITYKLSSEWLSFNLPTTIGEWEL